MAHSLRFVVCSLVAIAGCECAASADVLFSNFGEGDIYDTTYGWTLSYGGPLGGDVYEDAVPFATSGGDYMFDSAEVAINNFYGPDLVYFDLHADDEGKPGAILASTTASGTGTPGAIEPPMVVVFDGELILEDGRTYWLSARAAETDALLSWAYNPIDDFGLRAWRLNKGPWHPAMGIPGTDSQRDVYRINATPIFAPCYPDFTADGALDLFDFLAFVNAFNATDAAADCDRSGAFDLFDFLCFTNAFNEGC